MVNLTQFRLINLTQSVLMPRHPDNIQIDKYWRKRTVLKMASHFYGRSRNCYSLAIRRVQRALQYVTAGRYMRKIHTKEVWENRLSAGCKELGYIPKGSEDFLEALARTEIYLDRKSLSNLAIWEPRTFKCINMVAATKAKQEGLNKFELGPPPEGIFTRGKL